MSNSSEFDFLYMKSIHLDMIQELYKRQSYQIGKSKDMSDEEVLNLLADRKISVSPENDKNYAFGQRAADAIAKFAGSWAFIFSFIGVLVFWMVINIIMASKAFDPYPFILLNLVLSQFNLSDFGLNIGCHLLLDQFNFLF